MLTALRTNDQTKVIAWEEERTSAPFSCPGCSGEVVLKKGSTRAHHFAHKPPVTCLWGQGESEEHHRAKRAIYEALRTQPGVTACELERDLGTVRPDISAVMNGQRVAIEVQRSCLTVELIAYRTSEYHRKGIHVLWVGLWSTDLYESCYSPKAWERWLHGVYFGRMYYWISGQHVQPVHFGDYLFEVPLSTWYNEYGEEESAGGYSKRSKRYRAPQHGALVGISTFMGQVRREWACGDTTIPACHLLMDTQPKWW